jgi:hypothetical protein
LQNYPVHITEEFGLTDLSKGIYLVITEAKRIPPHIGLMVNGKYSSLTVKGNEVEVQAGVLLKNIMLRKKYHAQKNSFAFCGDQRSSRFFGRLSE